MRRAGCARLATTLLAALLAGTAVSAQERPSEDVTALDLVTVVGVSPVAGTDISAMKLPYSVQSINDDSLDRAQTLDPPAS